MTALHLFQYVDGGERRVAATDDGDVRRVDGVGTTYELALEAIEGDVSIAEAVAGRLGEAVDIRSLEASGALLPAIDHPDPAHLYLTGTGLTHLGSA